MCGEGYTLPTECRRLSPSLHQLSIFGRYAEGRYMTKEYLPSQRRGEWCGRDHPGRAGGSLRADECGQRLPALPAFRHQHSLALHPWLPVVGQSSPWAGAREEAEMMETSSRLLHMRSHALNFPRSVQGRCGTGGSIGYPRIMGRPACCHAAIPPVTSNTAVKPACWSNSQARWLRPSQRQIQ